MWPDLAIVAAGALLAAIIVGSAGFAFAMVATGIWIYVMPPVMIVLLGAICATLLHAVNWWRDRRRIDYRLLAPFVLGGVLGVPLGVAALTRVDPAFFRNLFGACMVAYALFMLARPRFAPVQLAGVGARVADGAVGWAGGVMGGLAYLHGVLPTIWCGLRGWDRRKARNVYQPYILFTGIAVVIMAGLNVDVERERLALYLLVCLPVLPIGFLLGIRIFERMSDTRFHLFVLWLILLSGITLLI